MKMTSTVNFENVDLSLEGYKLIGTTIRENAESLKFKDIDEIEQIDNRINEVIAQYDSETVDEIKSIKEERQKEAEFLKELKKEFENDKIKMEQAGLYTTASPKTVSLKSAIVRVGKRVGMNTSFVDYTNYGHYKLSSGVGRDYDIMLSAINEQDAYEKALQVNKIVEVVHKARVLALAQRQHRDTHDDYYVKYTEINKFQNSTSIVVSNDIFNNRDVDPEVLDRIYKAYSEIKEKYDDIVAITEKSMEENDEM